MDNFWKNRRVVVTGGAGFLGSIVVKKLKARGCGEIMIPRSRDYDLVELSACRKLYRDTKPDVVLHLAARVGGIGINARNPGKFFYDNLMMGVQMIEEGRRHGLEKFVAVGTICSYPKFTPVPFKEDDLWNGYPEDTNAPYGLAKKMCLVQGQAYRAQYGMNVIYLLPVNLYGPRDNFDLDSSHVIPALIRKCFAAMEENPKDPVLMVWGTGNATREFLYVEDAADGILRGAQAYDGPEPVNLGSGFEISINELVHLIVKETGFKGRIEWQPDKPDGQPRRCLDTRRARDFFGFEAKVTFEEGIKKTIAWYRENMLKSSGTIG